MQKWRTAAQCACDLIIGFEGFRIETQELVHGTTGVWLTVAPRTARSFAANAIFLSTFSWSKTKRLALLPRRKSQRFPSGKAKSSFLNRLKNALVAPAPLAKE